MHILSILIEVVVPVFLVAAVGFGWAKRGKPFDPTFVSLMVTVVGTPCLVIDSISKSGLQPSALVTMGLAAAVCHFAAMGIGYVVLRVMGQPINVYLPAMTFANTGNMGLPLTLFAFGEAGLALSIGYFTLASLLNFGLGQAIASKNFSIMAILKMPLVWAILLAMVLVTTGTHLPRTIERAMGILGGLTVPLMLVSLGYSLARLKIASLKRGVILSLVRLIGGFAIGWAVGWALGLEGVALGVVVTQSAMPSAVYNYMFAARFGNSEEEVAGMVILSTFISLFLLPLFLSTVM